MELRDCKRNPEGKEKHKEITSISTSPSQSRFFLCLCLLLCLFSLHLLVSGSNPSTIGGGSGDGSSSSSTRRPGHRHIPVGREWGVKRKWMMVERRRGRELMRRRPGSYPPRCRYKCGRCSPCRAVHVPVPPGRAVIAEYYPEAWRCKCRNRLYLP